MSSPDYYFKDGREVTTIGTGVIGAVLYGQAYDTSEGAGDGLYDLSGGTLFSVLNPYLESTEGAGSGIRYTDCWVAFADS